MVGWCSMGTFHDPWTLGYVGDYTDYADYTVFWIPLLFYIDFPIAWLVQQSGVITWVKKLILLENVADGFRWLQCLDRFGVFHCPSLTLISHVCSQWSAQHEQFSTSSQIQVAYALSCKYFISMIHIWVHIFTWQGPLGRYQCVR